MSEKRAVMLTDAQIDVLTKACALTECEWDASMGDPFAPTMRDQATLQRAWTALNEARHAG